MQFWVRLAGGGPTALAVAELATGHPAVRAVAYPGLPDHPDAAVVARQMTAAGGVVGLEFADAAAAELRELREAATRAGEALSERRRTLFNTRRELDAQYFDVPGFALGRARYAVRRRTGGPDHAGTACAGPEVDDGRCLGTRRAGADP